MKIQTYCSSNVVITVCDAHSIRFGLFEQPNLENTGCLAFQSTASEICTLFFFLIPKVCIIHMVAIQLMWFRKPESESRFENCTFERCRGRSVE